MGWVGSLMGLLDGLMDRWVDFRTGWGWRMGGAVRVVAARQRRMGMSRLAGCIYGWMDRMDVVESRNQQSLIPWKREVCFYSSVRFVTCSQEPF